MSDEEKTGTRQRSVHHDYYHLPEEEVQSLVSAYQNGDEQAAAQLLQIFGNFINKYVSVLYNGNMMLNNNDVRQFLKLFVNDKALKQKLGKNRLSYADKNQLAEILSGLQYMILRYNTEEDVRQTVELTFLECAIRYERRGEVPFSGFIYRYFLFLMKKNVVNVLVSQLGRKTFPLKLEEDMDGDEEDGLTPGFEIPPEPGIEDLIGTHEINEEWVAGDTALPPFDNLTVQERQILKWRFSDGDSTRTIAERVTENPNTVRDRLNTAREKIAEGLRNMDD